MPRVSVIIPCHNYGRYLPDAVDSVVRQTYRDFEIVIVNDGSTDDTAEVASLLADRHPSCKLKVINQQNQGASAARNNGIRQSRGEYIVALDADDKIDPSFLEETVRMLDSEPRLGIAYTGMVVVGADGNSKTIAGKEYDFWALARRNFIPTCNLFRKSAWEAAGGYKKLIGAEDWELWIAMGELGYFGKYLPKPLFLHRVHGLSKYSITSSRIRDVLLEIRKLHLKSYCPRLYRSSRLAALAVVYLRYWVTEPFTHYIYRKYPRLHAGLRGLCDVISNS